MKQNERTQMSVLTQNLSFELAEVGLGPRESARLLDVSPGTVMRYREMSGVKKVEYMTTEEVMAILPEVLRKKIGEFRKIKAASKNARALRDEMVARINKMSRAAD